MPKAIPSVKAKVSAEHCIFITKYWFKK